MNAARRATNSGTSVLSRREKLFATVVLTLVLVMGAACLLSQYIQQARYEQGQRVQDTVIQDKLCRTLKPLAALKAPAGKPADNSARLYEQQLASTLVGISKDIGCGP